MTAFACAWPSCVRDGCLWIAVDFGASSYETMHLEPCAPSHHMYCEPDVRNQWRTIGYCSVTPCWVLGIIALTPGIDAELLSPNYIYSRRTHVMTNFFSGCLNPLQLKTPINVFWACCLEPCLMQLLRSSSVIIFCRGTERTVSSSFFSGCGTVYLLPFISPISYSDFSATGVRPGTQGRLAAERRKLRQIHRAARPP